MIYLKRFLWNCLQLNVNRLDWYERLNIGAGTWANVDPDRCRCMASPGRSELISLDATPASFVYWYVQLCTLSLTQEWSYNNYNIREPISCLNILLSQLCFTIHENPMTVTNTYSTIIYNNTLSWKYKLQIIGYYHVVYVINLLLFRADVNWKHTANDPLLYALQDHLAVRILYCKATDTEWVTGFQTHASHVSVITVTS